MTAIWILLLAKALYCAAAALPTFFFARIGSWLKRTHRRRTQKTLEGALTRLSGDFHQDETFIPSGVGLAADFAGRRFFIAERDGNKTEAAILPFSALRGISSGEMSRSGFFDNYVDIAVTDEKRPSWRLLCGENEELASAVKETLGRLQAA